MLRQRINNSNYKNNNSILNKADDFQFCTDTLLSLKLFCCQCLRAIEIENIGESNNIDKDSVKKIIYSGGSDVIYIWMTDEHSAKMLSETINHWLICNDPTYNGLTIDYSASNSNLFIIELNYMDEKVIDRNKNNNIKTIIV